MAQLLWPLHLLRLQLPRQPKLLHHAGQPLGLLAQRIGRRRRLLDQRGVLLRHAVNLANSLADLADAAGLLRGCG